MSATPMKTDKKVFWFSRARSDGYLVCVIGALLLLLLGTVGLRFWLNTRFDDQIRAVRGQVLAARRCIQLFSEINGRLPESLEEFRRWWHEGRSDVSAGDVRRRRTVGGRGRSSDDTGGGPPGHASAEEASVAHVRRTLHRGSIIFSGTSQTNSGAAPHPCAPADPTRGARDHGVLAVAPPPQTDRSPRRWRQRI